MTGEQSTELTRLMKAEMALHEGKSDDEIRETMVPKYNAFLSEVMSKYPAALPMGKSTKNRGGVKRGSFGQTRRRSFGQTAKKETGSGLAESQSAASLEAATSDAQSR